MSSYVQARRNHLNDFKHGKMFGKFAEGFSVVSVAEEFENDKSVILQTWKAFQPTSTTVKKLLRLSN